MESGLRQTMRTGTSWYNASDMRAVPTLRKDGAGIPVEFIIPPLRQNWADAHSHGHLRDVTKRVDEMRLACHGCESLGPRASCWPIACGGCRNLRTVGRRCASNH